MHAIEIIGIAATALFGWITSRSVRRLTTRTDELERRLAKAEEELRGKGDGSLYPHY